MKVQITGVPTKKVKIVGVPESKAGGKWIQKAVNPKHKGYCTPMSKKTCTPARKAFAKRAKAGKLQTGGLPVVDGLQPGMEHLANIEAEAGEVYQDQFGGIQKISDRAPSHEQGGAFIPNAERVLEDTSMDRKDPASKKLKMSPDEIHTIFGVRPNRPMSHAKAYEFVKAEYGKDVERYNKSNAVLNDKPHFDRTKYNTARLNFINREDVPTDQDVFDTLFEHQEAIKAVHGIQNDGKSNKYGGYRMQAGGDASGDENLDFGLYHGPKYPKDKANLYTPTGKTSEAKLTDKQIAQAYRAVGQDFTKLKGAKLQEAIYNYLAETQPDVLKQTLQEYGANRKALTSGAGKLKAFTDPMNATADDLKKAIPYLVDNMPGARIPLPSSNTDQPTPPAPGQPAQPAQPVVPTFNPPPTEPELTNTPTAGRSNRFFEPTYWYDLAPGMAELADSFRRFPELYNPVDIHTLRLQQLNPEAALRANQGDYNAALHALGNEQLGAGARAANISNLTAQKYKANNQIIGEYTNRNADIKNREIEYNTQARDRQSLYDADSRQKYYASVLQSRDNQRLQRLQAIQDLSRVQQLKARQNASGNLILQMSPHFNQRGEYNGTPSHFTLPADIMGDGSFIPTDQTTARPVSPKATTRTVWKIGDKQYTTTVTNPQ